MVQPINVTPGAEDNMSLEQENIIRTAVVLANAGEIGVGIISDIAGNDISTAINGSKATSELIQTLLYQRIQKRLNERV